MGQGMPHRRHRDQDPDHDDARRKNAADITLAIDAMECLYTRPMIDMFAIASSDSDFAPLAKRLREMTKHVVGFGMQGTPRAFMSACDNFVTLETLQCRDDGDDDPGVTEDAGQDGLVPVEKAQRLVHHACLQMQQGKEDGRVRDSHLHGFVQRQHPWFDGSVYGYWKWTDFLKDVPGLHLSKIDSSTFVHAVGRSPPNDLSHLVRSECMKAQATSPREDGFVQAGSLKDAISTVQPDFDNKKYGFGKWKTFLEATPGLDIKEEGTGTYVKVRPDAVPVMVTVEDVKLSAKAECAGQANDTIFVHRLVRSVCKKASATSSREDGFVRDSFLKSSIIACQPDFDFKRYGFRKWKEFLESTPRLDTKREGPALFVRVRPKSSPADVTVGDATPTTGRKRKRTASASKTRRRGKSACIPPCSPQPAGGQRGAASSPMPQRLGRSRSRGRRPPTAILDHSERPG